MVQEKAPFLPITFREYKFAEEYPFILMQSSFIYPREIVMHFHNCIEIVLVEKGVMRWNLENSFYRIEADSICFIPPYFTHSSHFHPEDNEDEVSCYFLFFNPEELLAELYPGGIPKEFLWYRYTKFQNIMKGEEYREERRIIRQIILENKEKRPFYRQSVKGHVERLLVLLYRKHCDVPLVSPLPCRVPLLYPAISYLQNQYEEKVNMEFLAELCGLTKRQFLRNFRENFGQTPMQYLRTVRISEAGKQLIQTERSVLDIMYQSGYHSLSSFNRAFLQVMGKTPSAFRNEQRNILKGVKYTPYEDVT